VEKRTHFLTRGLLQRMPLLIILTAVLALVSVEVVSADGLASLLARFRIVQTPPMIANWRTSGMSSSSMPSRASSQLTGQRMSPDQAHTFFPFAVHYPSYVPQGFQFAGVESMPLTKQEAVVVLKGDPARVATSSGAAIRIVEELLAGGAGQARVPASYSIPPNAASVVQVAGHEGIYAAAVWSGNPPVRDDRFQQLIFETGALRYFLYAPATEVSRDELLRIAASLSP